MNQAPFLPPLDPDFQPAVLWSRAFVAAARSVAHEPLCIALEGENGRISRYDTIVPGDLGGETLRYVERTVKFLLWAHGGWRVWVGGPAACGEHVRNCYRAGGERAFDAGLMERIYERPLEVEVCDAAAVPASRDRGIAAGGHMEGCRIGFDLGASDYKLAAVQDGEVIYSDEFPWDPRTQPDPDYHYAKLNAGLREAASRLPRVDAIGGSSAGVIVNNRFMVASLIRSIPDERLEEARSMFDRLRVEWGVPLEVVNDGDVTALAGALSIGENGVLGIAMGSSEAVGFLTQDGFLTGWVNELAFAPVDMNPDATPDEWSGDRGVGALYFSQQAVNRLLPAAGIEVPDSMGLPERLKEVQRLMAEGDPRAAKIYETIGVYLGYSVAWYAEFYDFRHVLILGRVTTGKGGEILLRRALEVIDAEFPDLAEKILVRLPDEKSRRVGQACAAASLPVVQREILLA